MLIRKSKISQLIKKEREKERQKCEKDSTQKLDKTIRELQLKSLKTLKELKRKHRKELVENKKRIAVLEKEMTKNYSKYQEIRNKEQHLDQLTFEIEDVVENMVKKVQESIQPFYRTRGKVESAKRKGDRKNEKVENIFRAVK